MDFDEESKDKLVSLLRAFTEELGGSTDLLKEAKKAAEEAADAAAKKNKEIYEKQLNWTSKVAGAALGLAKSFSTGSGSFDGLANTVSAMGHGLSKLTGSILSTIPVLSVFAGFVEAAGKALTDTATFIIQTYDKFYTEFEKVSQVGIVSTTQDLKDAMLSTKMNFTDTGKVLSKYSKELAYFGGSAAKGRREFEDMSDMSSVFTDDLQKLGIGITEWNETQLSYVDRLARSGNLAGKSTTELAHGAREYQLELDKLSKITGLSRQDLIKERDDRMREAKYRAGISTLDEPIKKGIDSFLDQVTAMAPGMKAGIQDLIASGGVPVTEEAKAALIAMQQGGMNVQEFIDRLRTGQIGGAKAMNELIQTSKGAADSFQDLTRYVGADTIATKYQVDLMNLRNSGLASEEDIEKKIKELQEKTIADRESENSALAGTRRNLYDMQNKLELIILSFDGVTKATRKFTEIMNSAIIKMAEYAGVPISAAHRKLQEEEQKESDLKEKINKLDAEREEQLEKARAERKRVGGQDTPFSREADQRASAVQRSIDEKKAALAIQSGTVSTQRAGVAEEIAKEKKERGRASTGGPGAGMARAQGTPGPGPESASPSATPSSGGMTLEQLKKEGLKLRGYGDVHVDGSPLSSNLITLAKKIQDGVPGFKYISGLNDEYHRGTGSSHAKGMGMDFVIDPTVAADAKQVAAIVKRLQDMGAINVNSELVKPAGDSRWTGPHIHAEVPKFADGGIVNSATLGLIGEAGPEAVVPLSEDGIFNGMSTKLDRLISVNNMSALSSKLDSLISVTERQNSLLSEVFGRLT